jgi:hypothetical protein
LQHYAAKRRDRAHRLSKDFLLTAEQLQHARAAAWRQDSNALLTADDAAAWLREVGLTLFLPRTNQIAAPAPTLVEATMGEANSTPKPAAIADATSLLHRLLASQDVLALNLLGIPGDQPDFLATEDTLPFLFALRGDREWERGPRGKSTPLVLEVWKLLEREGPLSAEEIKDQLGKQLTETAALRALTDLWTALRVEPVYSEKAGTQWQRMEVNHAQAMKAGSAMAQGMALSALVSLYLQSAVAASADEIEAFLSPVTSRSRVREAVRGLIATRQVNTRNLGADELMFVEGSLPEFADVGDRSQLNTDQSGSIERDSTESEETESIRAPMWWWKARAAASESKPCQTRKTKRNAPSARAASGLWQRAAQSLRSVAASRPGQIADPASEREQDRLPGRDRGQGPDRHLARRLGPSARARPSHLAPTPARRSRSMRASRGRKTSGLRGRQRSAERRVRASVSRLRDRVQIASPSATVNPSSASPTVLRVVIGNRL